MSTESLNRKKAYIYIHIAVLLFGFTAILGDLIALTALVLVWWRVFLTSGSLVFFFKVVDVIKMFHSGKMIKIIGVGVLVSLHWLCFYGSIKVANVSVALVCMSTTSIFTSLIEPLLNKVPFKKQDLFIGLILVPCFLLVANYTPAEYSFGMTLGIGAAILAALFSVFNKQLITNQNVYAFTFIELFSACLFLSICLLFNRALSLFEISVFLPDGADQWINLLLLSLLCTTLAYILSLKALQHISAFSSNMIINLEPVYGIILAILLLGEKEYMHIQFYTGAALICIIVFIYPFLSCHKN